MRLEDKVRELESHISYTSRVPQIQVYNGTRLEDLWADSQKLRQLRSVLQEPNK